MTPDEIKSFFRSVYQEGRAWGTPEMLDEFYAHIAPEFVFHRSPLPDVTGIEANRQSDEAMLVAFSENKVSIDELIVEGDVAVLRYVWGASIPAYPPVWASRPPESISNPSVAPSTIGKMTRS